MNKVLEIPEKLYNGIAISYNKKELQTNFLPHVKKLLYNHESMCVSEGIPDEVYSTLEKDRLNKTDLVKICCLPFLTKNLFDSFKHILPEELEIILDELIWIESLDEVEIENRFGIKISRIISGAYSWQSDKYELKKLYRFFPTTSRGNTPHDLYLHANFRQYLYQFYEKPKNFDLQSVELGKTDVLYDNAEKEIFLELPRLIAFYRQGTVKLTKKGRPVANGMNKIQRELNLREFFEGKIDKVLKNIRTNALISLMIKSEALINTKDYATFIKELFTLYKDRKYRGFPLLMSHLKGMNSVENHYFTYQEHNFFALLKELPIGEWVTLENIEGFARYRSLIGLPIRKYTAEDKLYLVRKAPDSISGQYPIKSSIFYQAIVQPFFKANFFLFAAFGLVEIAYNQPDTTLAVDTYFSPYDGLQYVKLTELGAYVVGKQQTYKIPEEAETTPLTLSEDSLMILSDETDKSADVVLRNFAHKVGMNRYQTDATTFLEGCTSKKSIQEKIALFQETVTDKLPSNWKAFFDELLENINPLKNVSKNYTLFQIPSNNRTLIQLIAQDPILKKLILKGEGFHIFVSKANLPNFKKRLKEFGIFLT